MSFPSPDTLDATAAALTCPIHELQKVSQMVDAYVVDVMEQLRECQHDVQDLCHSAVRDGLENLSVMSERAAALEALFSKIDALQRLMDAVHALVIALNRTVKAIEAPADVKERAANFLKSFGLKSKVLSEHSTGKHAWGRVPQFLMIDGKTPSDFVAQVHEAVEALARCDST